MIPRISLIGLELLLILKNWCDPGTGNVSVPRESTNVATGIIESNIPTSHLVTTAMGFVITVTAICPVLATMLIDINLNGVELGVDVLGSISNNSSKLFVISWHMTIRCYYRFHNSFE